MATSPMAEASLVVLEEAGKELNFQDLFKQVIKKLEMDEATATRRIAKMYSDLTLDKRFISLPENTWDLRKRHKISEIIVISEDEEEDLDDYEEEEIEDMIDLDGFDQEKVKEYEEDVKELSKMAIIDEED